MQSKNTQIIDTKMHLKAVFCFIIGTHEYTLNEVKFEKEAQAFLN